MSQGDVILLFSAIGGVGAGFASGSVGMGFFATVFLIAIWRTS